MTLDLKQISSNHVIPHTWYPDNPPIYNIHKTYLENLQEGPFFNGIIPTRQRPAQNTGIHFLGHQIASPIGVPAGPLLGSRWIKLAAELGFDVVTYKTIRSSPYPSHPLPNMVYVEPNANLEREDTVNISNLPPTDIDRLTVTNSFGMPSMPSEFLGRDMEQAGRYLQKGQVMIVSVVGSSPVNADFEEDFVNTACFAKDAGAKIIEANFSCPNVDKQGGALYLDPSSVMRLTTKIATAIRPIPLIIKVGSFSDYNLLLHVMQSAARGGAQGFEGINTIKTKVRDLNGNIGLDQNRPSSGLCGGLIREQALKFVSAAATINRQEKLGLSIMGVGGATKPEHLQQFIDKGAQVALSATGMMWDPYLALRWHSLNQQKSLKEG
jgi:dihydroorotate dehydrogenase